MFRWIQNVLPTKQSRNYRANGSHWCYFCPWDDEFAAVDEATGLCSQCGQLNWFDEDSLDYLYEIPQQREGANVKPSHAQNARRQATDVASQRTDHALLNGSFRNWNQILCAECEENQQKLIDELDIDPSSDEREDDLDQEKSGNFQSSNPQTEKVTAWLNTHEFTEAEQDHMKQLKEIYDLCPACKTKVEEYLRNEKLKMMRLIANVNMLESQSAMKHRGTAPITNLTRNIAPSPRRICSNTQISSAGKINDNWLGNLREMSHVILGVAVLLDIIVVLFWVLGEVVSGALWTLIVDTSVITILVASLGVLIKSFGIIHRKLIRSSRLHFASLVTAICIQALVAFVCFAHVANPWLHDTTDRDMIPGCALNSNAGICANIHEVDSVDSRVFTDPPDLVILIAAESVVWILLKFVDLCLKRRLAMRRARQEQQRTARRAERIQCPPDAEPAVRLVSPNQYSGQPIHTTIGSVPWSSVEQMFANLELGPRRVHLRDLQHEWLHECWLRWDVLMANIQHWWKAFMSTFKPKNPNNMET